MIPLFAFASDRWKLKEITDEYHLESAKRQLLFADAPTDPLHQSEHSPIKHRDFVDDEDPSFFDSLRDIAVLSQVPEGVIVKLRLDPDTAPRMDGHAVDMGGRDTRRRGHSKINLVFTEIVGVLVDSVGLARAGLPRQKHVGPSLQNGKRLVLGHNFGVIPYPTIS